MGSKREVDWKKNPPARIRVSLNIRTGKLENLTDGEFGISMDPEFQDFFTSGASVVKLIFFPYTADAHALEYKRVEDEIIHVKEKARECSGRYFTYRLSKS